MTLDCSNNGLADLTAHALTGWFSPERLPVRSGTYLVSCTGPQRGAGSDPCASDTWCFWNQDTGRWGSVAPAQAAAEEKAVRNSPDAPQVLYWRGRHFEDS